MHRISTASRGETRNGKTHILQVRLVLLELRPQVVVVIADRLEDRFQAPRLQYDLLPQTSEMRQLGVDFIGQQFVAISPIDKLELLQFPQHLFDLDPLPDQCRIFRRCRSFSNRRKVERSSSIPFSGDGRDRSDKLDEDRLGLHVEDVILSEIVLRHKRRRDVLNWHLPSTVERQFDRTILFARDLSGRRAKIVEKNAKVLLVRPCLCTDQLRALRR